MYQRKRTSTHAALVFAFLLMSGLVLGGMCRRVEPKLPASIQAVEFHDELAPFIADSNDILREAAVARFAQIDVTPTIAVPELVDIFEREPRRTGKDANPRVRRQVVYALGRIGNSLARDTLETLLTKYLEDGPIVQRYAWEDAEYLIMIDSILSELARWPDARAKQTFERLYHDENYFYGIREFAYYSLLTVKFHELRLTTPEPQMRYLAQELQNSGNEWVKGKPGVKTESGIKNRTIFWRLYQFGKPAIPVIEKELESVPAGHAQRRKALLRTKTGILKRAENLRKKEQRKKEHNKEQ